MRKIYTIIVFVLFSVFGSRGQVVIGSVSVEYLDGDKARIAFDAYVNRRAVKSNSKLMLTPVLRSGDDEVRVSPIVVEGRGYRILDARRGVLSGDNCTVASEGDSVHYQTVVDLKSWYSGSAFFLDRQYDACGQFKTTTPILVSYSLPVKGLPFEVLRYGGSVFLFDKSPKLPTDFRFETDTTGSDFVTDVKRVELEFPAGSAEIIYNYKGNWKELYELYVMLSQDTTRKESRIDITGYASPEGSTELNNRLAYTRAESVRKYLLENNPGLHISDFKLINGGENWAGLRSLVEESQMPGRWRVLNLLDNVSVQTPASESLKNTLKGLNNGATWQYMLAQLFPKLRSAATVTVYLKRSVDPTQRTAENLESENSIVIEKATQLLLKRMTGEAIDLLYTVERDPRSWNLLGVCYAMENNISKAEEFFTKSSNAGYKVAANNLEQLNAKKK